MYIKHTTRIVFLLIVGMLLSTACQKAAPDPMTVQLSWFHNNEFIGFYVADQNGYYKDENIDIKLVAGGPTADPVGDVLSGQAQIGIATGDTLIRRRALGDDVVAVASIFRDSPLVLMSLPESNINRPQDLAGKTVGVISPNMDTSWDTLFLALLKRTGVDPASMTFLPIEDYHGTNELKSGRMDAMSGLFSINESSQAQLDGDPHNVIFYSEYGILIYVNPIFTTGALIRENPELVQRFIRATFKGYQYAVEHPEEVAVFALKYDDALDPELQKTLLKAEIPLIDTGKDRLGWMTEAVWKATQDILLDQGLITLPVKLDEVYTNQFVEQSK